MSKRQDVTGQVFNRLTAIQFDSISKRRMLWEFLCECGNVKIIALSDVKSGGTKSCGCLFREYIDNKLTTHGHRKKTLNKTNRTYITWYSMKSRCLNKKHSSYKRYGGRGITVCEEWMGFDNFLKDMGEVSDGFSLDRIDNNKGYFKENCRWATSSTQSINQRKRSNTTSTYKGVSFDKDRKKWISRVTVKSKSVNLGRFETEEEAALVYNEAAKKHYGEYAVLNIIEPHSAFIP